MQTWLLLAIGSDSVHVSRHFKGHKVKWLENHGRLQVNISISASQNPS